MHRRPLARYAPSLLLVACAACFEKEDTGRLVGDMAPPEGPDIEVDPTSLDFGAVMVGETETAEISVCNQGTEDLHIADTALAGGEPFSLGALEADVIAFQDCTTLVIEFAPSAIDTFTDTLTIASDDEDEPITEVALQGLGVGED